MYKIKFSGCFYNWSKKEDVILENVEKTFPVVPRVDEYVSLPETYNRVGKVDYVSYNHNGIGVDIFVHLIFS